MLDVACGTGNAAIRSAQVGGRITGVDLTPELFTETIDFACFDSVDEDLRLLVEHPRPAEYLVIQGRKVG